MGGLGEGRSRRAGKWKADGLRVRQTVHSENSVADDHAHEERRVRSQHEGDRVLVLDQPLVGHAVLWRGARMKRFPIPADRRVEARSILVDRSSLAANNTLPTKERMALLLLPQDREPPQKRGKHPQRTDAPPYRHDETPNHPQSCNTQYLSRASHQGLMHNPSTVSVFPALCLFHTRHHRSEGAMSLEGRQYCEWMALPVYQRYRCLLEQRLCIPVNQAFSSMNRVHTTPIL